MGMGKGRRRSDSSRRHRTTIRALPPFSSSFFGQGSYASATYHVFRRSNLRPSLSGGHLIYHLQANSSTCGSPLVLERDASLLIGISLSQRQQLLQVLSLRQPNSQPIPLHVASQPSSYPSQFPSSLFVSLLPSFDSPCSKISLIFRLHLPPSLQSGILHAICAATARFVGGLVLVPPSATLFPHSPQGSTSKNDLPGQPTWDGVGPRPMGTTKGLDEDFGQIHASWANLYIERVSLAPSEAFPTRLEFRTDVSSLLFVISGEAQS